MQSMEREKLIQRAVHSVYFIWCFFWLQRLYMTHSHMHSHLCALQAKVELGHGSVLPLLQPGMTKQAWRGLVAQATAVPAPWGT